MTKPEMFLKLFNPSVYGEIAMSILQNSDPSPVEEKGVDPINNELLLEAYWDNRDDIESTPEAEAYYAENEYRQYLDSCESNEVHLDEDDNYDLGEVYYLNHPDPDDLYYGANYIDW